MRPNDPGPGSEAFARPGDNPHGLGDAELLCVALEQLRLGAGDAAALLGCNPRKVRRLRTGRLPVLPRHWETLAAALAARARLDVRAAWLAAACRTRASAR
jgi:hypothetical protein